jgi:hypothetical protein
MNDFPRRFTTNLNVLFIMYSVRFTHEISCQTTDFYNIEMIYNNYKFGIQNQHQVKMALVTESTSSKTGSNHEINIK